VSSLSVVVALAELCASAPGPAPARDPLDSAAYADVGDEARAASDTRTAVIAYRKAIALDPDNARARSALSAVCKDAASDDDAALLAAIARYRRGERSEARAALAAVAGARGTSEAGAHFFLGLIALEDHDARTAIRELELARGDPELRELATSLLRLARRDGALSATVLVAPEIDTNPQLLPDTPPLGALTGPPEIDVDLLTAATITARPWRWLAIRNALTWRNQRRRSELDFVGENLQVVAELTRRRDRLAVQYDVDVDWLGGARYLMAHRAGAAYRREGPRLDAVASYAVRRRDYARDSELSFDGWVHAADAGAVVALRRGLELDARLTAGRELTADRSFANVSGGVRLAVRTRPTLPVRLRAVAATGYARYDRAQPDGLLRRDGTVEIASDVEIDLGDHVIAVGGASVTRSASSVEDFRYAKLVVRAGLVVALGAL
jgi:hypothetical protein